METETKIPKSYALYPSQIEWLEKQAKAETRKTKRPVSASAVLTNIIAEAQDENNHVEKLRAKIEPQIKEIAR